MQGDLSQHARGCKIRVTVWDKSSDQAMEYDPAVFTYCSSYITLTYTDKVIVIPWPHVEVAVIGEYDCKCRP